MTPFLSPNAFGTPVRSYAVCFQLRSELTPTAVLTSNIADIDFLVG